jgi:molybdate transport system ATP-binding protein
VTLSVDVGCTRGDFALDVALTADSGETVALLGPNGAGKSTLVGAIAGLEPPNRGRIVLDGTVLDDAQTGHHVPAERRSAGVVFQDLRLFPHLSSLENVAFPLRAAGTPKAEARRQATELLGRMGLSSRADARPGDLSGGEAQRVALARALVSRPRMLLLDEPLTALDASARPQIRALLRRELAPFAGVRILVTHDPVDAMTLADRVVIVERGRVTQSGTAEEIRDAPRTSYAADLVGVNLFNGRLERLPDGAGRIVTAEGDLVVGWSEELDEGAVIGLLRPADVALHTSRPEGGSARNVLRGRVATVAIEGERARVRLDSRPPVAADVTLGSLRRLAIHEGAELWASFKAIEVRVLPS